MSSLSHEVIDAILAYASLSPTNLGPCLLFLATFVVVSEYTRIALVVEATRSRTVHLGLCLLTFAVQSIVLAAVLVYADVKYPGRGFVNLGIAAAAYLLWYVVGQSTRLVRRDSEGADIGFMSFGALITFPVGLIAAILTRG